MTDLEQTNLNNFTQGEQINFGSLPMTVWLRGDEPYVADFCLTAEEAMQELGIKRSRLTQISGRELRVGRQRVDKYVRPVFRKVDIEEYKNWTRATATHQKSSSVIEEAVGQLVEQNARLTEVLENLGDDLGKNIYSLLREALLAELEGVIKNGEERLGQVLVEKIDHLGQEIIQTSSAITDRITAVETKVAAGETTLSEKIKGLGENLSESFVHIHQQLFETLGSLKNLGEYLAQLEVEQDDMKQSLQRIREGNDEISGKIEISTLNINRLLQRDQGSIRQKRRFSQSKVIRTAGVKQKFSRSLEIILPKKPIILSKPKRLLYKKRITRRRNDIAY